MAKTGIPHCVVIDQDDYTFYYPRHFPKPKPAESTRSKDSAGRRSKTVEHAPSKDGVINAVEKSSGTPNPYTNSLNYSLEGKDDSERVEGARLLAASCFQGNFWSLTVRSQKRTGAVEPDRKAWNIKSGYKPSKKYKENALFSVRNICEVIRKLLFASPSPQGAVIITGATASAKSKITMGLIHDHLSRCVREYKAGKGKRKPHLVTVEDPIEEWFVPTKLYDKDAAAGSASPTSARRAQPVMLETPFESRSFPELPIDYTPRELNVDVGSVSEALTDALRQTPSAVFISEIRDDGWKSLMDFAGTGHLVFATGHAGSLAEAMRKILKALEAETPADRAEVAERILGLIHVRRETVSCKEAGKTIECPALTVTLWRRMGVGKQSFISDGLAALTPQAGDEDAMSSYGRLWLTDKLLESRCDKVTKARRELCRDDLLRRARELDLEGL